jgi:hypothetical protein
LIHRHFVVHAPIRQNIGTTASQYCPLSRDLNILRRGKTQRRNKTRKKQTKP